MTINEVPSKAKIRCRERFRNPLVSYHMFLYTKQYFLSVSRTLSVYNNLMEIEEGVAKSTLWWLMERNMSKCKHHMMICHIVRTICNISTTILRLSFVNDEGAIFRKDSSRILLWIAKITKDANHNGNFAAKNFWKTQKYSAYRKI